MPSFWLFLAVAAAAGAPQAQAVVTAPGSSVRANCGGSSASGGGGWNLLDTLSNLLLDDDDDNDDDEDDDDDGVVGSNGEHRADSDEDDDYSWLDLGLLDDSSSEEAARRQPVVPGEVSNNSAPGEASNNSVPGEVAHNLRPGEVLNNPMSGEVFNNSLPGEVSNNSVPGEVSNNSLPGEVSNNALPAEMANNPLPGEVAKNSLSRHRRAAPNWSLGDVDVQSGKNWSVRVFNWLLVRRDPATDRVEVKLLSPNLFSSGASDSSSAPGESAAPQAAGDIDVQGGKNWSVRVLDWVLVRRNPATDQVEVKLQFPGLYPSAGGGDDDIDA